MKFKHVAWRKLYCHEQGSFALLPWMTRASAGELLKACDDSGRIAIGTPAPGVPVEKALTAAIAYRMGATQGDRRVMQAAFAELLKDGYLTHAGTDIVVRNFCTVQQRRRDDSDPSDEKYQHAKWRKLYVEEQGAFALLSWLARAAAGQLLKACDDAGRIDIGAIDEKEKVSSALARAISFRMGTSGRSEVRVMERVFDELFIEQYLVHKNPDIIIRNFIAAQRRWDGAGDVEDGEGDVPGGDGGGHNHGAGDAAAGSADPSAARVARARTEVGSRSDRGRIESVPRVYRGGHESGSRSDRGRIEGVPRLDRECTESVPRLDRECTESVPRLDRECTEVGSKTELSARNHMSENASAPARAPGSDPSPSDPSRIDPKSEVPIRSETPGGQPAGSGFAPKEKNIPEEEKKEKNGHVYPAEGLSLWAVVNRLAARSCPSPEDPPRIQITPVGSTEGAMQRILDQLAKLGWTMTDFDAWADLAARGEDRWWTGDYTTVTLFGRAAYDPDTSKPTCAATGLLRCLEESRARSRKPRPSPAANLKGPVTVKATGPRATPEEASAWRSVLRRPPSPTPEAPPGSSPPPRGLPS